MIHLCSVYISIICKLRKLCQALLQKVVKVKRPFAFAVSQIEYALALECASFGTVDDHLLCDLFLGRPDLISRSSVTSFPAF